MERNEILQIMAVLRGAYPHFYRDISRKEAEDTVNLWQAMFAEDDARLAAAAVKSIVVSDTREFPPTIAHVKEQMRKLTERDAASEQEAWLLVKAATRNGLYGSKEEFAKLPPNVQKLVGSASQLREWSMMDSETLNSVVASNFMRSYKVILQREQTEAKMPRDVLALVSGMSNKLIGSGEDGDE